MPRDHEFTLREHFLGRGRDVSGRCQIVHYENLPGRTQIESGTWVFVAVDQLRPGVRRMAEALERQLDGQPGIRVLNRPSKALHRHELLATLHARGHNDFRPVSADGDLSVLRYPVFVRSARFHNGPLSPLLHSRREVDAHIGWALLRGYQLRDLLAIEFCDTSGDGGMFRKYSACIVGDRVVARSLQYGRNWIVKHMAGEFSRAMHLEARDYVVQNPHSAALAAVFKLAHVEYGRMDYGFSNGRLQVWEINLNPSIGRGSRATGPGMPAFLDELRQEINGHFYREFRAAFEAIDHTEPAAPVPIALENAMMESARMAMGVSWPPAEALWRRVGPLKPLLAPWLVPLWHALLKAGRMVARATTPLWTPVLAGYARRARQTDKNPDEANAG